ncbi:MAG: hypothetical protein WAN50_01410 [Minisyncoccia bacterium]
MASIERQTRATERLKEKIETGCHVVLRGLDCVSLNRLVLTDVDGNVFYEPGYIEDQRGPGKTVFIVVRKITPVTAISVIFVTRPDEYRPTLFTMLTAVKEAEHSALVLRDFEQYLFPEECFERAPRAEVPIEWP